MDAEDTPQDAGISRNNLLPPQGRCRSGPDNGPGLQVLEADAVAKDSERDREEVGLGIIFA